MNAIKTKAFLIFSLSFLIGLFFFFCFRLWQVKKTDDIPFIPQKTSFKLEPPSDSLRGKFINIDGKVKKLSRNEKDSKPASKSEEVLQGESLITENNSQAILEFSNTIKIKLFPETEINFVNLLPQSFLVQQKSGIAIYEQTENNNLSVRSLYSLVTLNSGKARIIVDDKNGNITVEISQGSGQIAFSDLENKTHVWKLEKSQKAVISDEKRVIQIMKTFSTF